jgi:hypothetical protein
MLNFYFKTIFLKKLREYNFTQSFAMHSMHPKRIFNDTDMNLTLKDLGLAPTATILVIPVSFFLLSKYNQIKILL